ncbi:hypothetical protein AVEN_191510-1 [Araneus ventricosus]|uniref:Uncharacterized protein n=1 Tax=Araneus ventricosus TaxID=182803 RepID=A0A4Y2Q715_ARAVE|nr:hypothetical protein AVEN_191510-1 [Araneus ventricosus]
MSVLVNSNIESIAGLTHIFHITNGTLQKINTVIDFATRNQSIIIANLINIKLRATPQFELRKILWVAVSSTVGLGVERRHHLQSVCLQDVVSVDQTDDSATLASARFSPKRFSPVWSTKTTSWRQTLGR